MKIADEEEGRYARIDKRQQMVSTGAGVEGWTLEDLAPFKGEVSFPDTNDRDGNSGQPAP